MSLKTLLLAGGTAIVLSACAPFDPDALARYNATIEAVENNSSDRTRVNRIAGGITRAQAGITLGCSAILDSQISTFLSKYCLTRQIIGAH